MENTPLSAIALVFDGVEEVEAIAPVDVFRRAGIETQIAGLEGARAVTGRNGIKIIPDTAYDDAVANSADLFFLPGGPGVFPLQDHAALRAMLRQRVDSNKLTAAICAAPSVLAAEGLLDDKPATGHSSIRAELPQPSDDRVVTSGLVVTSQGAGTAIECALQLVGMLQGEASAAEIAASIHS